jgi:Spy/CpxP family protein refolding chaperone
MFLTGLTVLALSAGVVAGMLAARLPAAATPAAGPQLPPPPGYERSLADELDLNETQRQQMREIWEGVRGRVHRAFDDAKKLSNNQLDELAVLMDTPEQKAAFAQITKKYADKYAGLERERNQMFEEAVARTNAILTPDQQKKYAEIRQKLHQPTTQMATLKGTTEPPAPGTQQ